jgi:hypothetical protein
MMAASGPRGTSWSRERKRRGRVLRSCGSRSIQAWFSCSCLPGQREGKGSSDALSCDDHHRRVGHPHLQGARKRQADHGEGADQHADRDQPVFGFAHFGEKRGPRLVERRAPYKRRECSLFCGSPARPQATARQEAAKCAIPGPLKAVICRWPASSGAIQKKPPPKRGLSFVMQGGGMYHRALF